MIAKHCTALGYVNMAEENVQCECQRRCPGTSVQQSARSSSQQVTMSRQQPAATEATSSNRSSGSKRARRPTKCFQAISRSSQEIVRDVEEKVSSSLWVTTRSSNRIQKVRTGRILASSQTETSSRRATSVSVARRCCSSRVSLAQKPAESTTLLLRAFQNATLALARICTPGTCCTMASPYSEGLVSTRRRNAA